MSRLLLLILVWTITMCSGAFGQTEVRWYEQPLDASPSISDTVMTFDGAATRTATVESVYTLMDAQRSANVQSILGAADYAAILSLLGIEVGATADLTASEIIALIDASFGGSTAWRTQDGYEADTNLTAIEIETLLDAYYEGDSWRTGTAGGTDDQKIDTFTLVGTTLSLSLEGDGEATKTVTIPAGIDWTSPDAGTIDPTNYADNTGTDDQKIDVFTLVGTTLSLSLEGDGEATKTLDFGLLQDGYEPDTFVTNKDAHDHNGGDGAQIDYGNLVNPPTLAAMASQADAADSELYFRKNGSWQKATIAARVAADLAEAPLTSYQVAGYSNSGACIAGVDTANASTLASLGVYSSAIIAAGGNPDVNLSWRCIEDGGAPLLNGGAAYVEAYAAAGGLAVDGSVTITGDSAYIAVYSADGSLSVTGQATMAGGTGYIEPYSAAGGLTVSTPLAEMLGGAAFVEPYTVTGGITATGAPAADHVTSWETGLNGWTSYDGGLTYTGSACGSPVQGRVSTANTSFSGSWGFALSGSTSSPECLSGYASGYIQQQFTNVDSGSITFYGKAFTLGFGTPSIKVYRNGTLIGTRSVTSDASFQLKSVAITGGSNITIRIESDFAITTGSFIDLITIPGGG